MPDAARYLILTPMRNERATIEATLRSVCRQTVRPTLWLILADGATDGSTEVVLRHAREFSWIRCVDLPDRGFDLVGKGVAQVLNRGLALVRDVPSEFVAKLDADLDLPPDYFERLLARLRQDPRLAICSGQPYTVENGRRVLQRYSRYFPTGSARVYRRPVLDEIGEFVPSVGWDTVDLLRARMRGYRTEILSDVVFLHMRPMGTRDGAVDGMIRDGRNAYLTGYTPWFFAARALFNARYRPYLLRSACMLAGYAGAALRRVPRVVTADERAFHVRLQRRRVLLRGIDS